MPRVAVGGFHHETNSFAPTRADFEAFVRADAWPGLLRGEALIQALPGQNIGASGFIEAALAACWDIAPLLWANAGPSGPVTEDAFERITAELIERVGHLNEIDAVYLCLHGAMIADHVEDGEGALLARLRNAIGPTVPIVASLDFHANVTQQMVDQSDGLVAYRTYPHLDMAETGRRSFDFLERLVKEGRRPEKIFRKLPYLVPISAQCTLSEPAAGLFRDVERCESGPVWSTSFTMGFPPADIRDCGPAILAYGDAEPAEAAADRLFARSAEAETQFAAPLLAPDEAVSQAKANAGGGGPIILADTQDNPGAGGTSDTTFILRAFIEQGAPDALIGIIYDPDAATAAHRAGKGAEIDLEIGGRSGIDGDRPFAAKVMVEAISNGRFEGTGPFFGGSRFDLGAMALVRILQGSGGVRVVLSSVPQQAADRAMFEHLGAEPASVSILAVKSSVHFRADFGPIAKDILVVAAPGANIDDPMALPYRRIRSDVRLQPGVA